MPRTNGPSGHTCGQTTPWGWKGFTMAALFTLIVSARDVANGSFVKTMGSSGRLPWAPIHCEQANAG